MATIVVLKVQQVDASANFTRGHEEGRHYAMDVHTRTGEPFAVRGELDAGDGLLVPLQRVLEDVVGLLDLLCHLLP
jgi:hypothetical protein